VDIYTKIVFPLLSKFDAERTHDQTLHLLEFGQKTRLGRSILRLIAGAVPGEETLICGLAFPNVIGVAAGFDKNARVVPGLAALGFGHVEIGTLTPKSQLGNPKPRIIRLRSDEALINRMGFPNDGSSEVVNRLKRYSEDRRQIIGVSIGKQKKTPISNAVQDYLEIMQEVYPYANYLAVNISSPNTPDLRDLHHPTYLDELLASLTSESEELASYHGIFRRPLFVKISPDLTWEELDSVLDLSMKHQVDGLIATNTTIERDDLVDSRAGELGGLSGRPLAKKSNEIIAYISRRMNGTLPIIGVGGIFCASDVQAKIDAGASLVQVYTGLVYEGPGLAGRILRDLHYV
jgi:dihydroorotate dehydrogenase